MHKTKFLGVRMEKEVYDMIEEVTHEENLDKTSALKKLIKEGWKELKLKKALNKYMEGVISVDKAAKIAGLTVHEMMKEIAAHGIKSDETLEEYRISIELLTKNRG